MGEDDDREWLWQAKVKIEYLETRIGKIEGRIWAIVIGALAALVNVVWSQVSAILSAGGVQ